MPFAVAVTCLLAALYPDYGHVPGADFAEVGPACYRPFRRELRKFYPRECHEPPKCAAVTNSFAVIHALASKWANEHPDHTALELRRVVYRLEREHFVPVIFPDSPFYFEAGINGGYNRGDAAGEIPQPGRVTRRLCDRFFKDRHLVPDEAWARKNARSRHHFGLSCGAFVDEVHDLPPFHAVFAKGFGGLRREVADALKTCPDDDAEGRAELEAMIDALDTIHVLQLRFSERAGLILAQRKDLTGEQTANLRRIEQAAKRCPWEPPRSFYEGLNTLWFLREMMAYADGLCCNALGRPDAWLIDFYRRDLAAGRLTEAEARDLVAKFMIHSDCHLDGFAIIDGAADQEAEMPITLGGCDADGRPVWNELTRLFIEEHRRLGLVFPKLHARYGDRSPLPYLELIAKTVLDGHCVFALFNDDVHIPLFVRRGLPLDRARDYEGTGCWDGFVDTATDGSVGNYTSAIHTLIAAIHGRFSAGTECGFELRPVDRAKSFAEFRSVAYDNNLRMLKAMLADYTRYGGAYGLVSPCPLYSAALDGCVERRHDCRRGGMSWAPRVINIGFLANVVDSMCAIEQTPRDSPSQTPRDSPSKPRDSSLVKATHSYYHFSSFESTNRHLETIPAKHHLRRGSVAPGFKLSQWHRPPTRADAFGRPAATAEHHAARRTGVIGGNSHANARHLLIDFRPSRGNFRGKSAATRSMNAKSRPMYAPCEKNLIVARIACDARNFTAGGFPSGFSDVTSSSS